MSIRTVENMIKTSVWEATGGEATISPSQIGDPSGVHVVALTAVDLRLKQSDILKGFFGGKSTTYGLSIFVAGTDAVKIHLENRINTGSFIGRIVGSSVTPVQDPSSVANINDYTEINQQFTTPDDNSIATVTMVFTLPAGEYDFALPYIGVLAETITGDVTQTLNTLNGSTKFILSNAFITDTVTIPEHIELDLCNGMLGLNMINGPSFVVHGIFRNAKLIGAHQETLDNYADRSIRFSMNSRAIEHVDNAVIENIEISYASYGIFKKGRGGYIRDFTASNIRQYNGWGSGLHIGDENSGNCDIFNTKITDSDRGIEIEEGASNIRCTLNHLERIKPAPYPGQPSHYATYTQVLDAHSHSTHHHACENIIYDQNTIIDCGGIGGFYVARHQGAPITAASMPKNCHITNTIVKGRGFWIGIPFWLQAINCSISNLIVEDNDTAMSYTGSDINVHPGSSNLMFNWVKHPGELKIQEGALSTKILMCDFDSVSDRGTNTKQV